MKQHIIVKLTASTHAKATLIWLAHSGGSAAFFQELSSLLPDSIECLAVEYPGRGRRFREALVSDFATIVEETASALAALPRKNPIILFGHSLGGRVGFEVCRRLRAIGSQIQPTLLVVSACDPPHVERVLPLLCRLPDDQLVNALLELNGGTSMGEVERELLLVNLKLIRSDLTLGETHRFTLPPVSNQNLAVYAGRQDTVVRHDTLPRWQELSSVPVTFSSFEGGHFYMLQSSAEFLARLTHDIFEAVERSCATRA
jgi:surfactin synthase thioesterase subunit